jgi:surfactin synthase thioesterase subunit
MTLLTSHQSVEPDSRVWRTFRRDPVVALVCLPYAGGGTSGFRSWADALPDHVELVVARYPGREHRYHQPVPADWPALVDDCADSLTPYLRSLPCVLFGHSMGALLAHELAARWAGSGWLRPAGVVVSEHGGPHRPRTRSLPAGADDDTVARWLARHGNLPAVVLADPELRAMAVALLRADLRPYHRHGPALPVRHDLPVQVLYATGGALGEPQAREWAHTTTASCTVTALPGGHFYTPSLWHNLPGHLSALRGADHDHS